MMQSENMPRSSNVFLERLKSIGLGKTEIVQLLQKLRDTKVNILLVGGTGTGKSSTINALFDMDAAKVGIGSKPETMDIRSYELENLIIWDTPGLGDSEANDKKYKNMIAEKLKEKDASGRLLIDMVFLIIDGKTRDYKSAYSLIHHIAPYLGKTKEERENRLLVGINKCDMADDGDGWDKVRALPDANLRQVLDERVQTTQKRILDDTGLSVTVFYYSAGRVTRDNIRAKPYNLGKLQTIIMQRIPEKKRLIIEKEANNDENNFNSNDSNIYAAQKDKMVEKSILAHIMDLSKATGSAVWGAVAGVGSVIKNVVEKNGEIVAKGAFELAMQLLKNKWGGDSK